MISALCSAVRYAHNRDTLKVVEPPLTPASPMFASAPTSPTTTSRLPRFLQSPGKDKERERERQRIHEAKHRRALDAARVATNLAYIVRLCAEQPAQRVRHRTCSERHFSGSTPPPSMHSSEFLELKQRARTVTGRLDT
ncbi:hypothetical protein B0H13DRAFT_2307538 [Mycena leptocephala]|nr:hypothetical protein B0H13DRAFT_2307538 [Mycena leptocephala]